MKFSGRIEFTPAENRLAQAVAIRRVAGTATLDGTVSNPTLVGLAPPSAALAVALSQGDLASYQPHPLGPAAAREAIAVHLNSRIPGVDPDDLVITTSTSESYAYLFKLLCDPGDEIAVPRPGYPLFDHLAGLEGIKILHYPLAYHDDWAIDFSGFPSGAKVAAVVVVSPGNPTGSYLRQADLARLADFCHQRGCALIVDEVFTDYPLNPRADAVLSVAGCDLPCLTFVLGGLSKSCGLPQMKLGWMLMRGPSDLRQEARARLELIADTYLSVATPVLTGLPRLLEIGAGVRANIGDRITGNLATLHNGLAGSAGTVLPVEAGWSAIVRLPSIYSDEDWALYLLDHSGALVQPGYFYDLDAVSDGSHVVVSLLVPPDEMAVIVAALVQAANHSPH